MEDTSIRENTEWIMQGHEGLRRRVSWKVKSVGPEEIFDEKELSTRSLSWVEGEDSNCNLDALEPNPDLEKARISFPPHHSSHPPLPF
jgi:hypothetical protein